MEEVGLYFGIVPTSEIPRSCVHKRLSHTAKVNGKEVKYYEVWVKDPNAVKSVFDDTKEPNPEEISALTNFFNFFR